VSGTAPIPKKFLALAGFSVARLTRTNPLKCAESHDMTSPDLTLDYYFDPLCGWCYASAPALAGLAAHYPDQLTMRPSGLFFDPRPVAMIADHAEHHDRHIQDLTGQPFSEAYHKGVMRAKDGVLGSNHLTRALVALGQHDRRLEPTFLHAAQIARYVNGRDTSQADAAARVACDVAAKAGISLDVSDFADRLENDPALARTTLDRVRDTQARQRAGLPSGVPLLVATTTGQSYGFNGEVLYGGPSGLLAALADLLAEAAQ
jgi:putative protein-disulfide isomerase